MKEITAGHQETPQTEPRAMAGPGVGLICLCTVRRKEIAAGHQESPQAKARAAAGPILGW